MWHTSCSIWFPKDVTKRACRVPCPGSSCATSTAPNQSEPTMPSLKYAAGSEKMAAYRRQIADIRQKMRTTLASVEPQEVSDYEFKTLEGTVRLSDLFGAQEVFRVAQNMG